MSRAKKWAIRNALYQIEISLPKKRIKDLERERDLITTAAVALWDEDTARVAKSLLRLQATCPERSATYAEIFQTLRG
jgi:hypothetical protein